MRLLRNLPIAMKLGVSVVAALVLLGALTFIVLGGMMRTDAMRARSDDAMESERTIKQALAVASEMTVASSEIQYELTHELVQASVERAAHRAAAAAAALNGLLAHEQDKDARAALERVLGSVGRYDTSVTYLAQQRTDGIALRDDKFIPLETSIGFALARVQSTIEREGMSLDDRDMAKEHLTYYQNALAKLRSATQRFLATADATTESEVTHSAAAAKARIGVLGQMIVSAEGKSYVDELDKLGIETVRVSASLFDTARALSAFATGDLAASRATLERDMQAAVKTYTDRAEMLRREMGAISVAARQQTLAIGGTIAVLLCLSGWLSARAIARPIRQMQEVVTRMAAGETAVSIGYANRKDEIGRMAAALEALRGVVRDAFVRSQMIEQIPKGVMTAEPSGDFRITYVNAATMQVLEAIKEHLPVPLEEIAGQSIDIFHEHPERQRALLADPANLPLRKRIVIGKETLELNVSAILDRDGAYVGPMLTWEVLTDQVRLVERFDATVGAIARVVGESAEAMKTTATTMSEAADDAGRRTMAVAGASEEASSNVQSVAASAEELAASVEEIGRQVAESARIAGQAVQEAAATDHSVAGLSEAAGRIGDVVRLIGDIAARTNLLALNATIEAARAGEAGKGFAVVASEVKTLATQTARATEEIGAQISAMQGATGQAVGALRSIGATIQRMSEIATAIAGAVEQQGAATQEIARSVQHAASGTAEVTSNISLVTQAVEVTGTQAGGVLDAATKLSAQSDTLKSEVASFLQAVQRVA
jgi:methyl-accepting chemotaxis protein